MSEVQLRPSSAPLWGNCAGSHLAQKDIHDPETEEKQNGTAQHWVVSEVLSAAIKNPDIRAYVSILSAEYVGRVADNGVRITADMADAASVMCENVMKTWARWAYGGELLVEQRVYMPDIHETENEGTLDCSLYVPGENVVYLWDYKGGRRSVAAEGNLQIVNYAKGLVNRYGINGLQEQGITAVIRVVQPNCYHPEGPVRDWVVRLADLRPYWNKLHSQAYEALGPNPRTKAGPWCRDCLAIGKCSSARAMGYDLITYAKRDYEMDAMSSPELSLEYKTLSEGLKALEERVSALYDELEHRTQAGDGDTGYALQATEGSETWAIPDDQVIALFKNFDIEAFNPRLKTPRQVRLSAPRAVHQAVLKMVKSVTTRTPGKLKLIPAEQSVVWRAFKPKGE